MALPVIVCLKSVYNNKYLRYNDKGVQTHDLLKFSAEKVLDPYAQFEVVNSTTYDGLVHLKSCFTNNYLVRWSPNHYWISATAFAPNEDQTSWSCTLFKPIFIEEGDNTNQIRLMHVQLGHYACLWRYAEPFDSCLFAASSDVDKDSCDVFNIVDYKSLYKLPKHVAFKGDNGKYLGPFEIQTDPFLQFSYDDPKDPKVAHEIFLSPDGTICIKSNYYGKFWALSGGESAILVDSDEPRSINNVAGMFRLVVIDGNELALQNMGNTKFCKRHTSIVVDSGLSAIGETIDKFSKLEVIDLGN